MLAKLHTFSLLGIDALPAEVEVDVSPGALPKTVLVGILVGSGQIKSELLDQYAVVGEKLVFRRS